MADAAPSSVMASQQRSVRVVVRVRPILSSDGEAQQSLLVTDASRQEVIVLGAALEPGQQQGTQQGKRYAFDNVFGPTTPQVRHALCSRI